MTIMTNTAILRAAVYATVAHGEIGHTRKYPISDTNENKLPYIVHPLEVAERVARAGGDVDMIVAAILHDVVEDTLRTIEDIEREFGAEVARLVAGLTDVSKPEDGNRKVRKEMDRVHLSHGCYKIQTVKLADVLCNGYDIMEKDPGFAFRYMREIRDLVATLHNGDAVLHAEASHMVSAFFERVGEKTA